ncbi:MAG: DUF3352 domain-containing protein [Planctomycetota bacterium]
MAGFRKAFMLYFPAAFVFAASALAATEDFSRYVPDSTLVFTSWNLTGDALKDYEASPLAKFLHDKEVKELLGKAPLKRLSSNGLAVDEIQSLLHTRMALAILDSEMVKVGEDEEKREEALKHSAALFDISDEKAKALARKFVDIFDRRSQENDLGKKTVEHKGVKITIYDRPEGALEKDACFAHKDIFVVASTEKAARQLVEALQGNLDKPLSKSALFQAARKKVGDHDFLWTYVNTSAISKRAADARTVTLPFGKAMDNVAAVTGADKIQSVVFSISADKEGLAVSLHLLGIDPKASFMQAGAGAKDAYKCMELVPADAQSFVALSVRPSKAWDIVEKILADESVKIFGGSLEKLAGKEKKGGFDFKKDFLENLGEEAFLITPPPVKNGGTAAPVTVLPVKDRAKVEKVALALFQEEDEKPVETKHNGHTIFSFAKRSFVCTDKYIIFGKNIDAIKAVLDASGGTKKLLKDDEEFNKVVAVLGAKTSLLARVSVERFVPLFLALMMLREMAEPEEPEETGEEEEMPSDEEEDAGEDESWGEDEEWPETPGHPEKPVLEQMKLLEKFNQYFKYFYMAVIPDKDGLTIRVLIR